MVAPLRSAIVVEVPEAAAAIDGWRERTSNAKPSAGVPAHITILFPFVPALRLDGAVVEALRQLFASFEPIRYQLGEARRFPGVLYLAPDPPEPFVALTEAVVTAFPAHAPYEGVFGAVIPHVTAAEGQDEVLDGAEADIRRALPISCHARELLLLEEIELDPARWRDHMRFPLGAA